jgi:mono/diheme cytochrome c family protein
MNNALHSLRRPALVVFGAAAFAAVLSHLDAESAATPAATDLDQRVGQIFERKCAACHFGRGNVDAEGRKGRNPILNAQTTRADLIANQGDKGWIDEADPAKSAVHGLVALPAADEDRMPKTKKMPGEPGYLEPLQADEIAAILQWVSTK